MRKNKKLFAILTLVAFMMTLMPVLAFAGDAVNNTGVTFTLQANGNIVVTASTNNHVVASAARDGATVDAAGAASITISDVANDNKLYAAAAAIAADDTIAAAQGKTLAADAANEKAGSVILKMPYGTDDEKTAKLDAYEGAAAAVKSLIDAADSNTLKNDLQARNDAAGEAAKDAAVDAYTDYQNAAAGSAKITALDDLATALAALTDTDLVEAFENETGANRKDLIALNTAVQGIVTDTLKSTKTKVAYNSFATKYDALNATAKNLVDSDANVVLYTTTKAAVDAWSALKNDPSKKTLQAKYKAAYAKLNPDANTFNSILGDASTIAGMVATETDADVIVELINELDTDDDTGLDIRGPQGTATPDASIIATKNANATVEVYNRALAEFPESDTNYTKIAVSFKNASGGDAPAPATTNRTVYDAEADANVTKAVNLFIWAEESGRSNQASDAFVLEEGYRIAKGVGIYAVNLTESSTALKAAFLRNGSYSIRASFTNPLKGGTTNTIDDNITELKLQTNKTTITANAIALNTRLFVIKVEQGEDDKTVIASKVADGDRTTDSGVKTNQEGIVTVSANTVATTPVTLTVYNYSDTDKKYSKLSSYPVKLSTNSANIELDSTNVTTDYNGEATFNIAGIREGEYKVYVTIGDYESTIIVQVGATSASDIQLIKFPSYPIATDTLVDDYDSIFQFRLTDANGNIVAPISNAVSYTLDNETRVGGTTPGAAAATDDTPDTSEAKYVSIVKAPEANKVKNADLYLFHVDGEDYYTLRVGNNKAFTAEGDYEVRVVLDNGKSATLNFSVKKFDKAVSLHIEYPTSSVELNSTTVVPDIYFLDASNVMKKANNRVTVAAQGYAVANVEPNGKKAGQLKVKNDEKYIGQTITVTAASDKENLMASTTLTVADEAREVKLDSNRGAVNANNRIGFKVVDSTGNAVALGNDATVEVTAVVTNTGDADAKVSYSVSGNSKNQLKADGTGVINLSSNKQTTATVQIMVKVTKSTTTNANDNNTGLSTTYYSGTETFTFGAEADKSVVMTIGSKEIVAQNVPVTIDVAPFIQDNRTYVPFRALVEAFGAEVDYNADNNTVTTKLDGKTVVLTVGSTVLTVNDETVTMDVAPFIVDDRVVVPVRFVGEAFGFTVEATQDADTGATASVVFYQK